MFPKLASVRSKEVPFLPVSGSIAFAWTHDRRDANARTGSVEGSVDENCDFIRDWGADAVLSLTEFDHERVTLPLEPFERGIRERRMRFFHLPIQDRHVPTPEFEESWRTLGPRLRNLVRHGSRIVIHAEGHLARSAMIIARLFVELGCDQRETFEQLYAFGYSEIVPDGHAGESIIQHVYAQSALMDLQPDGIATTSRDGAVGALLGLAIGDALGASLDQQPRENRSIVTDMVGGGPLRLRPGEWTGNTAMALALADTLKDHDQFDDWAKRDELIELAKDDYTFHSRGNSLARGRRRHRVHLAVHGKYDDNAHHFERALMERFARWMKRGEFSCNGRCVGISEPLRTALLQWQATGNPIAKPADLLTEDNSSLVRVAPVAIFYRNDRRRLRSYAIRQSLTTHGSRDAFDACIAFADIIAAAIDGAPIAALLECDGYHTRNTGTWPGEIHKYWSRRVAAVLGGSWHRKTRADICTAGDAVLTLEAALWCIARSESFEESVLCAVSLGEDSAALAAVVGQLAGAIYGVDGIPEAWRQKLVWHDRIVAQADWLFIEGLL